MDILKINPGKPETGKILAACSILKSGGLVVFPTETVYGLGADMLNRKAVRKIFAAKNRPSNVPLIVHVSHREDIEKLAVDIPPAAYRLTGKFWPGPLTVVLKKKKNVPYAVTAGTGNVAIRMPSHPVALSLIGKFGRPIVATSANKYNKVSPTAIEHVEDGIGDIALDGGRTSVGLESTILDLTAAVPKILRQGSVSREDIEKEIGALDCGKTGQRRRGIDTQFFIERGLEKIKSRALCCRRKGKKVGIIASENNFLKLKKMNSGFNVASYGAKNDYGRIASMIYPCLHSLIKKGSDLIIIEEIKKEKLGSSIMERLDGFVK